MRSSLWDHLDHLDHLVRSQEASAVSRTLRSLLTISLKVGFLVFLEILVLRLEVLCGSGSR